MSDTQTVEFLTWLTEGGRVRLWYGLQEEGRPDALWLGILQVTHSDLSRVARHWAALSPEAAGSLAGRAIESVSASAGREWRPTA